jgi:hypothetical protein
MLCPIDCNILASADLALHIALTFSSGTRPNAGGVNRGGNTANNTKARFIRTPHAMRLRAREPIGGYRGSLLGRLKTACRPTRVDRLHRVPDNHLLDMLAL